MQVLAIVSRDLEKGSTKYRLVQYLDYLAARGVRVEFVRRDEINDSTLERARRADLLFNQKCLVRCSLVKKLLAASRRVIFDFDDAIYTRPGKPFSWFTQMKVNRRFHLWLRQATVVTAANEFLAGYARRYTQAVETVPMALDLETWSPAAKADASQEVTIGWAGAPVNVHLLERLDPVLCALTTRHPFVKLAVFSGQKPRLRCPFEYHSFRPGAESQFVRSLDIGLLPLADEEFTRGKSPIKALQYLACGVPVVGNVIGATAEIVNDSNGIAVVGDEGWLPALERLVTAPRMLRAMGAAGRAMVEQKHNFHRVADQLLNLLLAGHPPKP
jgi:glycosyltransferase involved in cell wall biosynthesis